MNGKICPKCDFTNVQGAVCCGSCGEDISASEITDVEVKPTANPVQNVQATENTINETKNIKMMDRVLLFFVRLVGGKYGLAKTFWLYGLLVGIVFNVAKLAAQTSHLQILYVGIVIVHFMYLPLLLIGAWRASDAYQGNKAWPILVKISIVIAPISIAFDIYMRFIK